MVLFLSRILLILSVAIFRASSGGRLPRNAFSTAVSNSVKNSNIKGILGT
jgi:hypothetical protein